MHSHQKPQVTGSRAGVARALRAGMALVALAMSSAGCAAEEDLTSEVEGESAEEVAFPGEQGELSVGSFMVEGQEQRLEYERIHGQQVFEGDMILGGSEADARPVEELAELLPGETTEDPAANGEAGSEATQVGEIAAVTRARLWPGGVVYYAIASTLADPYRVVNAIRHWSANTRLRFVRRTNQRAYVLFVPGSGCAADVGYRGGLQRVYLARTCTTGNVIHEIGHTIGLWHEQARPDRDRHVRIHWNNIIPNRRHAFQTYRQLGYQGQTLGAYDLGSIMHYGPRYFSRNGQPTITRRDGSLFRENRRGLSRRDIDGVNRLYGGR